MTLLTLIISLTALTVGVISLLVLRQAGLLFRQSVPARAPVITMSNRVNRRGICNNDFKGNVKIKLDYPPPPPPN